MNIPKIDNREASDILKRIKELAKQYVPEWKYDENDPDLGVVFSKIFSSMFEDTINNYNNIPYNDYISFLNLLGVKLSPPITSSGMVTVDVVPESDGVYIEKGSSLYASADIEDGRVFYETTDGMFATDAKINSILMSDSSKDMISKVYDITESQEKSQVPPFSAFANHLYENLQKHIIYFEDKFIFRTNERSDFIIKFVDNKSAKNNERLQNIFLDKSNVTWQYYKDENWNNIELVEEYEGGVRLRFESSTEPYNFMDDETRLIRCIFNKIPHDELYLTNVACLAQMKNLKPDVLLLDNSELSNTDFFPFGEQYNVYTDFYIASDEAFTKKGAVVKIEIQMQYVKVKINTEPQPDNTRYRYIMTDLDFQTPQPSDVEIEKVVWEYWNGIGWAKLYQNNENQDFFITKGEETGAKILTFECPEDMKSITLGPKESCFIRARIEKVKNQLNVLGDYITPYVHAVDISYHYNDYKNECRRLLIDSNMKKKIVDLSYGDNEKVLLKRSLCEFPTIYLCLDKPIKKGPTKILFDIERSLSLDNPSIIWQYYAKNKQGEFSWQNIDIIDSTENLSHSAIVTMVGKNDFAKTKLFDQEGYFIRIINPDNRYSSKSDKKGYPLINGIYFNTVEVKQIESNPVEYFYIENAEEKRVCKLAHPNVVSAEVWVNEFGHVSTLEEESLIKAPEEIAHVNYNEKGRVNEIWVKWEQVPNLSCALPNDRSYEVDYINGFILFGDGKNGKIPAHQENESIRIQYSTSQGRVGNVSENKIEGFSSAVPYINKVSNLKPMIGGADIETVEYAAKRMSGRISGMDRIVSLEDFENLIKYNDRSVCRVECVAHVNELNEPEPGTISIAVLPKDYMQGFEKFLVLKNRIDDFIKEKAPLTLVNPEKINVFEVMYVELSVSLDVVISDYNDYQKVYQDVYNKLKKFLNPINGNFDNSGWNIGQVPRKELIYNYLKTIKNIKWIKEINVFAKLVTVEGKKEIDFEDVKDQRFTVPVFGEPEINISVD